MHEPTMLILAIGVFAYAATARRLAETPLTMPVICLALGLGLWSVGLAPRALDARLDIVAEIALAVVLFSDAARTDARALLRAHLWPTRMLALGLPLAILIGFAAGALMLPDWPLLEVALVAAILAPTDAALGQAVATSPLLPERVRRALVVESGLNDGLALPLVLLFATLAGAAEGAGPGGGLGAFVQFMAAQIGFGALTGLGAGLAGGALLGLARARRWPQEESEGIAALAIVGFAYFAAEAAGGNAFVACFTAGLGFGAALSLTGPRQPPGGFLAEFLDGEGQVLVLAAFVLIGTSMLPQAFDRAGWLELSLVLVSLFLVRPLAIWLSLSGTGAPPRARLFLGWFGPRGLATALFALVAVEGRDLSHGEDILAIAGLAVAVSAILHGASAAPAARRWGPKLEG
ncbi:cation:proton antiporter [Albimonas sp. CAU 1670]|uniref:cation:proton antiporter domain-containing protein n=1 Tax=Albimonas sp. CAU 1670 TaxID=3032599 RepID=UPI0023DA073E|nr:cation:proton antiporter [Albimonas sp. CAU 1670]MDF2234597.1 cation:proton antiporter [Albimonas sp. CAU 1670]